MTLESGGGRQQHCQQHLPGGHHDEAWQGWLVVVGGLSQPEREGLLCRAETCELVVATHTMLKAVAVLPTAPDCGMLLDRAE